MSVSHSSFGAAAVKSRSTRSSWTGGPGLRFRPRFFENTDQITKLNAKGDALREAFLQAGIQCNGFGSLIRIFPADMTTTWWKAYREGVLLGTSGLIALSTAMDEGVIEEILQCVIRISQQ